MQRCGVLLLCALQHTLASVAQLGFAGLFQRVSIHQTPANFRVSSAACSNTPLLQLRVITTIRCWSGVHGIVAAAPVLHVITIKHFSVGTAPGTSRGTQPAVWSSVNGRASHGRGFPPRVTVQLQPNMVLLPSQRVLEASRVQSAGSALLQAAGASSSGAAWRDWRAASSPRLQHAGSGASTACRQMPRA